MKQLNEVIAGDMEKLEDLETRRNPPSPMTCAKQLLRKSSAVTDPCCTLQRGPWGGCAKADDLPAQRHPENPENLDDDRLGAEAEVQHKFGPQQEAHEALHRESSWQSVRCPAVTCGDMHDQLSDLQGPSAQVYTALMAMETSRPAQMSAPRCLPESPRGPEHSSPGRHLRHTREPAR